MWARVHGALIAACLCGWAGGAIAQDQLEIDVLPMEGYGRIILSFPDRLSLPDYTARADNGVLAVEFDEPVDVKMPDVAASLPAYLSVSRVDPDGRGVRFGLKTEVQVNRIEAAEQLYLDVLPPDWQGERPSLPQEIINKLADRAERAAEIAERRRIAELARRYRPEGELQVGRHPTFTRLEFDWSVGTSAEFVQEGGTASIKFSWPVSLDLYPVQSDMPAEIESIESGVEVDGTRIRFDLAEGVTPRFYEIDSQKFILDIDRLDPQTEPVSADELLAAVEAEEAERRRLDRADDDARSGRLEPLETSQTNLTPEVSEVGSNIRIHFPFEVETPAAVFRRGDHLWMVFDTPATIDAPEGGEVLGRISTDFSVTSTGTTQVVRMQLSPDRLASLASQGAGWLVSVGEVLMTPTEPIKLNRREDENGRFDIAADLESPVRVHDLRDPDVGDVLKVVTMFPPARGIVRRLDYVDFQALRSIHGMVVRPLNDDLDVALSGKQAVIGAPGGLTVSQVFESRARDEGAAALERRGYMDLKVLVEPDPAMLRQRRLELEQSAAMSDGQEREKLRLRLAQTLLANQFSYEALGVLDIMIAENNVDSLIDEAHIAHAAATAVAGRYGEALDELNTPVLSDSVDALMWRTIARTRMRRFEDARADALASEAVIDAYPDWVRNMFLMAGAEAAIEVGDMAFGTRLMERITFSQLDRADAGRFEILQGRLDELDGRIDEALDTYGRVIAADVRPTRAEAVYRTIALLDEIGRLDVSRAADTLWRESILWRGGPIEAKILELLADLQFRSGDYQRAFATVQEAAASHIETPAIVELTERAQEAFIDLYLNGRADSLEPIDALTLYYDYRNLTPAGARGDEMIRNLARRLVRVDLLEQAADLLEYQVDRRLEGAARARVAADAAIVHLANRQPDNAIDVLRRTSLTNLPPSLLRQRRILEARALVDAGRSQLALDVVSAMDGRDADLMRVDAYWRDGAFREAAEQIEIMYSRNGVADDLSQTARLNLTKAAVGFVLGNDKIGLDRLRSKFAETLSETPEWPMFDYVTGAVSRSSRGFRDLASEIANRDSLASFLASYRQTYGDTGGLAPRATAGRDKDAESVTQADADGSAADEDAPADA